LSTLKKFAGQTAVYGLSTIISRLLNSLLTPIYVNLYPAKIYGIFTTMYAMASMLNAVLSFGMETTFFRYINKYDDKKKVYSTTFFTILLISSLFLLLTSLFAHNVANWMHDDGSVATLNDYVIFVKLFIWILVTDAIAVIPFARVRAEGRPGRYAVIKSINIIVTVLLNLFFLYGVPWAISNGYIEASWFKPSWVGYVFVSNLIASLITLLLLLPELLKVTLTFDGLLFKQMLYYSFPMLIANLSFIVNEHSDKMFIEKLLGGDFGKQEVGIYGAVCKLAIFLSIFINAFRLGAEPFFFSHAKNKNSGETYAVIMNYFVIAMSVIFVALVANIEILKYFIPGSNEQKDLYWSGLKVVPVLLLGYVSLGIYMNLSIWYKLSDQTRYGLYISAIGAILTIILNIIFIPKYSYVASAWISLTAYASMMVLSYFLGQRNYPIPYNLNKNLAYLFTAIIIVFLSFNTFNRNLIAGNLLLAAFIAGTLFFERKEIKAIFRK